MSRHAIDYSKSTRSVCKGPAPCTGSSIPAGGLRYGQILKTDYSETVSWRHWGCVTPDILRALAITDLNRVTGFSSIKHEDQQKVRRAVAAQRVDPADVPATARVVASPMINLGVYGLGPSHPAVPAQVGQKRKHSSDAAGSSYSIPIANGAQGVPSVLGDEDDEAVFGEPEPEQSDELYCVLETSTVGIQYYNGLVASGEQVRLVREPRNRYDRNAIQVKNIGGDQVGHLPRNVASQLAPLLDQSLVIAEGVMHEGNIGSFGYSLSMSVYIYGLANRRDMLEPMLIWATPRQRGFPQRGARAPGAPTATPGAANDYSSPYAAVTGIPGPSQARGMTSAQSEAQQEAIRKQNEAFVRAAELKEVLSGLERVDDDSRRASLLDSLCTAVDVLNLPVHPNPPGIASGDLVVDLLKHQSQALQWCIDREYPKLPTKESDSPVQFWQYRKSSNKAYYFNLATKSPLDISTPPALGKGALVADSMGLGKTLTMISVILATKNDIPKGYCNTTLVVVPLSVISNWEKQIEEHCVRGSLSVGVYYGASRNMTSQQLMMHDVVITTYQVVTSDADFSCITHNEGEGPTKKKKKRAKGLFDVKWKRIILDEGHTIRNPKTKMAMAVCMLTAERRWVLSGTPIINSPRDLGSILTFLQICHPLGNEDFFKRLVLRPLKQGDPNGAELFRALMSQNCIRRTKEMQDSEGKPLVPLPPVDITLVPVTLSNEARTLYDAVELASRQRVENLMNQVGGLSPVVTTNVLSMLTRLRQIALHPGLVPTNYLDQLRTNEATSSIQPDTVQITPELKEKLEKLILQAIEDNEECPICFNILMDPRITPCTHVFCSACISEVIARDPKCPMDRRPLTIQSLMAPPPPTDLTQVSVKQNFDESECSGSSAKIDQLIHILKLIPSDAKGLVFSQFTSFLDKIGEALEEHDIPYVRFDGQLSARKRQEVIERFSIPLEPDESPAPGESLPPNHRRQTRTQCMPVENDDDTPERNGSIYAVENSTDDDDFEEDISTRVKKTKEKDKKGKGKGKAKAFTRSYNQILDGSAFHSQNPKVMLISLKAGALGLNLTVANHVFLMDPWWQEGIESQAIDRCNRIGQTKPVHVYQLIAEDTIESKVIEIQERKKHLIQHVFSGIKRTETQREKREARLQDLIELFGIRNRS